jgi:hypothetical protein
MSNINNELQPLDGDRKINTQYKIRVMTAYVENRHVQYRELPHGEWKDFPEEYTPWWNWKMFDYRIIEE